MRTEILLALGASFFTALASVAQRRAAAPAPGELSLSWRLVAFLIRRPVWFLGIVAMIAGFLLQVAALKIGSLSLVQPVIATELLFVFGFVALGHHRRVETRDWLSAVGMAVSLGCFLALARPSGGTEHASTAMWTWAGLSTASATIVLVVLAYVPGRGGRPASPSRKAALMAVAAATMFGFVAAVIKELSTHLAQGPVAVFTNWSPYALLVTGAAAMFLASNAFQAGTLAASQPGLTIVDPLVSSALGVVLFGEEIRHDPLTLVGEAVALTLLVASVVLLSRSPLVHEASASQADGDDRSASGNGATAGPVTTTGPTVTATGRVTATGPTVAEGDRGRDAWCC
jgi:drug/metabolite transporter (DMT)-like permease